MKKLFAIVAIALIVLLALMWKQLQGPSASVELSQRSAAATPAAAAAPAGADELAAAAAKVRAAQARGDQIDPASDAMIYAFDERLSPTMLMAVAKCYDGIGGLRRVHRNQQVKLNYNVKVKDGAVTIHDVRVVESSINDKPLVDCFVREAQQVTWHDAQLPDWQQDDELVISPERGMKKFLKDNMAYEGDSTLPEGKLEMPIGPVAASREMPADHLDARKPRE